MAIRFFDMFSGIGGFRAGLEAIGGFECVGHCEIDKYASYFKDYLRQHLPEGFDPEWLEDLSCQSEGNHLLRRLGGMVTDYGVIAGRGYNLYDIVPFRETPVAAFEEVENEEPQLGGIQL